MARHKLVQLHEPSGRMTLYIAWHVYRVDGWTREGNRPLIRILGSSPAVPFTSWYEFLIAITLRLDSPFGAWLVALYYTLFVISSSRSPGCIDTPHPG